jgi:hypothetical protein
LTHVSSLVDNKIEQYEDKFRELKSALQEHAVVQTEIVVLRVLDVVENISFVYLLPFWVVLLC